MVTTTPGYWCECRTTDTFIASIDAPTAAHAVRWIAITLHTILPALDPDASADARRWLQQDRHTMTEALHQGEPVTLTIRATTTHITWTARPAHFLPLAHRHNVELPACAEAFSPTL
ncbi:hypothetical protein AB0G74_11180 [Streptomyces sp. NPDC020875]|uniref:hypothetical protein n=1 Tax=Streptomyces sp. NPDC020875 TaxID=3154898 RepID=UPI0033CC5D4B